MKRVLITGISGFVGYYLSELLKNEYEVHGLDRQTLQKDKIKFHKGDITNPDEIQIIMKKVSPNIVFHLAAQSSVSESFKDPEKTMKINVGGTLNIVNHLPNGSTLLLTCSAEAYGVVKHGDLPIQESHPLAPTNPYAKSKVMAECAALESENKVIVTRSFNHTGPGRPPIFVLSDWAKQIAEIENGKQEPVIKVGNLDIRRDFLDVRDVVRAYKLLAEKAERGIYNVCSGKTYSLKDLLLSLISFSSIDIKYEVDPEKFRPSDNPVYLGDNTKLRMLGWEPKIPIAETLHNLVDYWRTNI